MRYWKILVFIFARYRWSFDSTSRMQGIPVDNYLEKIEFLKILFFLVSGADNIRRTWKRKNPKHSIIVTMSNILMHRCRTKIIFTASSFLVIIIKDVKVAPRSHSTKSFSHWNTRKNAWFQDTFSMLRLHLSHISYSLFEHFDSDVNFKLNPV